MSNEKNNDLKVLKQMESLRLENKISVEEQLALINDALLDDNLTHEEVNNLALIEYKILILVNFKV